MRRFRGFAGAGASAMPTARGTVMILACSFQIAAATRMSSCVSFGAVAWFIYMPGRERLKRLMEKRKLNGSVPYRLDRIGNGLLLNFSDPPWPGMVWRRRREAR